MTCYMCTPEVPSAVVNDVPVAKFGAVSGELNFFHRFL